MRSDMLKTELKANLNNLEDKNIEKWMRTRGHGGIQKKVIYIGNTLEGK